MEPGRPTDRWGRRSRCRLGLGQGRSELGAAVMGRRGGRRASRRAGRPAPAPPRPLLRWQRGRPPPSSSGPVWDRGEDVDRRVSGRKRSGQRWKVARCGLAIGRVYFDTVFLISDQERSSTPPRLPEGGGRGGRKELLAVLHGKGFEAGLPTPDEVEAGVLVNVLRSERTDRRHGAFTGLSSHWNGRWAASCRAPFHKQVNREVGQTQGGVEPGDHNGWAQRCPP